MAMNTDDAIQLKDLVSFTLIILGWLIVHHFSIKREINKELRFLASQTLDQIEKLEYSAKSYHCGARRDTREEREIKKELEHIRKNLRRLGLFLTKKQQDAFRNYRLAIAGENFESNAFSSQPDEDSPIIRAITVTADKLGKHVEEYIIESSDISILGPLTRWKKTFIAMMTAEN